jgi:hypothetical protein
VKLLGVTLLVALGVMVNTPAPASCFKWETYKWCQPPCVYKWCE